MAIDRTTLFAALEELGIRSTTVAHAPVFTVEQSTGLRATIPGAHTKNLFLTDKDGRLVLVVAKDDTRVDLKALAKRLGLGRFSLSVSRSERNCTEIIACAATQRWGRPSPLRR